MFQFELSNILLDNLDVLLGYHISRVTWYPPGTNFSKNSHLLFYVYCFFFFFGDSILCLLLGVANAKTVFVTVKTVIENNKKNDNAKTVSVNAKTFINI